MDDKMKNSSAIGGVIMVGCMFVGLGLGMYYHHIAEGLFIGLGAGFVAMGVVWAFFRQK